VTAERSIIRIDFDGGFERVEGRPEEAALHLLLDAEQYERCRPIIESRGADLSRLLVEQIDLVKQITDAIMSGDTETAQELQQHLYDRFDPAHSRDPLLAVVAGELHPEEIEELQHVLDEYWRAWIDWELRETPDQPPAVRRRVEQRLVYQLFQEELQDAYQITLQPYRQRLDAIYEITEATPEQRAAIRDAVIDLIREGHGSSTPEQRMRATRRIHAALDEQQRIRLFDRALWRR
jgi:hypothetical protein